MRRRRCAVTRFVHAEESIAAASLPSKYFSLTTRDREREFRFELGFTRGLSRQSRERTLRRKYPNRAMKLPSDGSPRETPKRVFNRETLKLEAIIEQTYNRMSLGYVSTLPIDHRPTVFGDRRSAIASNRASRDFRSQKSAKSPPLPETVARGTRAMDDIPFQRSRIHRASISHSFSQERERIRRAFAASRRGGDGDPRRIGNFADRVSCCCRRACLRH